jgi:hypothetical protein
MLAHVITTHWACFIVIWFAILHHRQSTDGLISHETHGIFDAVGWRHRGELLAAYLSHLRSGEVASWGDTLMLPTKGMPIWPEAAYQAQGDKQWVTKGGNSTLRALDQNMPWHANCS